MQIILLLSGVVTFFIFIIVMLMKPNIKEVHINKIKYFALSLGFLSVFSLIFIITQNTSESNQIKNPFSFLFLLVLVQIVLIRSLKNK